MKHRFKVRPSPAARPFCTEEPTRCGVCRAPAVWLGYGPLNEWKDLLGPVMWLCGETACHQAAREVYHGK